jgi:hypothetical protein
MTEAENGPPTLEEGVRRALSGRKLPDDARDYFSFVRSNYTVAAAGLLKWAFTAIASAILFQLIALAAIKGATFGGVTLRSLGIVEKALPVFIAYSMFRSSVFGGLRRTYGAAHHAFMAEMDAAMVANDLEKYLLPADVFLFRDPVGATPIRAGRAYSVVTVGLNHVIATGIVWFEVYAFYRLFKTYGADDPGTWISLAATLPLLILYTWVDRSFAPTATGSIQAPAPGDKSGQ